ncbi:hypothetical protein [Flavobacterium daejeonense]|uniref:hypothetical protein n=1 Tax=Flavobacterium daejeonense TaxID=350893 RepID=UPI0012DE1934|nr:hypothetical protein [Flavobacterium daejeonense]
MTFVFGIVNVFADTTEPPSPTPGSTTMSLSGPVTPPGLPIDTEIVVMMFIALLFGLFKIYISMSKKKRPV